MVTSLRVFGVGRVISHCCVAVLACLTMTANAETINLVSDNFERADSDTVGNGWTEWWSTQPPGGDIVSVFGGRLRIAHNESGTNRDGGIFRPLAQTSGLTIAGTVEWFGRQPSASVALSLNSGVGLGIDSVQNALLLNFGPSQSSGGSIGVTHGNAELLRVPFNFDLAVPYNFEWVVNDDHSTDIRLWLIHQARPNQPTASTAPLSFFPQSGSQFGVMATGGAGCCIYLPYDVRFDNLVATSNVPLPSAAALLLSSLVGLGVLRGRLRGGEA